MSYKVKNISEIVKDKIGIEQTKDIVFKLKGSSLTFYHINNPDAYSIFNAEQGLVSEEYLQNIIFRIKMKNELYNDSKWSL